MNSSVSIATSLWAGQLVFLGKTLTTNNFGE